MSTAGAKRSRAKASSLSQTWNWSKISRENCSVLWTTLSMLQKFETSLWQFTWSTKRTFLTSQSMTKSTWPSTFATGCSNASLPVQSLLWFLEIPVGMLGFKIYFDFDFSGFLTSEINISCISCVKLKSFIKKKQINQFFQILSTFDNSFNILFNINL